MQQQRRTGWRRTVRVDNFCKLHEPRENQTSNDNVDINFFPKRLDYVPGVLGFQASKHIL